MDDKFKNLGFRDFVNVDYTQEDDDLIAYQAKKRHRGVVGEEVDLDEMQDTWIVELPDQKKKVPVKARNSTEAIKKAAKRAGVDWKTAKLGKVTKEEVEQVDEVISRSERLKRAPSMDVIQNRARKQAKNQMISKWTRGADKGELSMGRKAELEKRLKKMGPKLDRMAKKLVPTIRKQDRERRSGGGEKK
jgi:hypothetical protein